MKKLVRAFIKAFCFLASLGMICFAALLGINLSMIASAKAHIITVEEAAENGNYDCILVLGAKINSPASLSHMLEDRVKYGIECYKKGAAPVLLLSGDHGREEYDEVNAMKLYCVESGVAPNVIFLDHAGFNTYDSMYRARDIFLAKRVLIVTQKFHLSRAVYIARSLGLEADGVASDPRAYGTVVYDTMREFLARTKAFIFCTLKPPPTYLGDTISLDGPASLSDDKEYPL